MEHRRARHFPDVHRGAQLLHVLEVQQAELVVQNAELLAANDELRHTNDALVNACDRFRALYEHAPTPYITVDRGGTIIDVNRTGQTKLAANHPNLIGGTLDVFVDDASRAMFRRFLESVFVTGHARCGDLRFLGAGGTASDMIVDGLALPQSSDEPPRCVLALVDITARKMAEQARQQAQEEMLAIVSHDLRSPLHAIALAVETLGSRIESVSQKRCVAVIERATVRCERLVSDLLGVAHLESGRMPVELLPVDADEIVEQACLDHHPAATAAGCKLTLSLVGGPHPILGDRDRLHQVLSNLIRNAVTHARGAAIEMSVTDRGDQVVITVADDGPGIAADELPYIFEKYRQGAGANHHGGAGLGLAIVRGVVLAHHGTTSVTSELGHGARFEVSLPRRPI